jgi:RNA polymerase sigma-70 factor (ECF subfamily)
MSQTLIHFSRGVDLTSRRSWRVLQKERIDRPQSERASDGAFRETVARGLRVIVRSRSDEDLLRAIAGGDRGALGALVARHNTGVFRFAMGIVKDRSLAEEVVNDVFFAVARRAGTFQGRSRASTWILGITRNKAVGALDRREPVKDELADTIVDATDDPETVMQKRQSRQILADCIRALPAIHREIIDLVYYHQKTIREIADILQIPAGTVKTRMFYARKALAAMLAAGGKQDAPKTDAASQLRSQIVG